MHFLHRAIQTVFVVDNRQIEHRAHRKITWVQNLAWGLGGSTPGKVMITKAQGLELGLQHPYKDKAHSPQARQEHPWD